VFQHFTLRIVLVFLLDKSLLFLTLVQSHLGSSLSFLRRIGHKAQ